MYILASLKCRTSILHCNLMRNYGKSIVTFFGSSVIAGHGLPPVTIGIGVWLDGVGQAGMYGTAERMNGRMRLHRCRRGIPVNNGTRIEGGGLKTRDRKTRHGQNCRTGKREKRHVLKAKLRTPHVVVILVWC